VFEEEYTGPARPRHAPGAKNLRGRGGPGL